MKSSNPLFKSALLAIALLAADLVFALPTMETGSTQDFAIPEGYTAGQMHITGEIGGVAINHTGSVQVSASQSPLMAMSQATGTSPKPGFFWRSSIWETPK